MCEGICAKCREIVQWRFRYDKYKPLKSPATCQECHNKTIYKAYRTICDYCAGPKKVCASCCGDINALLTRAEVTASRDTTEGMEVDASVGDQPTAVSGATENEATKIDVDDDSDVENCAVSVAASCEASVLVAEIADTSVWDAKKFQTLASQKYSKSRVVGSEEDSLLSFGSSKV